MRSPVGCVAALRLILSDHGDWPNYAPPPATTYYYTEYYTEPAIIVDAPRSLDQAITKDVLDVQNNLQARVGGNR